MSDRKRGRKLGLVAAVVIVLSGFAYLLQGGISSNLVYFLTPGEVLAKGDDIVGDPIRLGGQVVPGTVSWDAERLDLRFRLQDEEGSQSIEVHATKAPPQMFVEGIGVIVEGRLTAGGVFESDNLMVKHSNEYRPPAEGEHPADLYKTLIVEGK
ncbi:MAG TPA: cytochrome c maturation protein CcmE [Longimicrobiales bacterium]|nr:cytochrome c maturation protein CcmE [Longimicrobiales bacterium]